MGILNWLFGNNQSSNVDMTQKYLSDPQFQNSVRIINESIKIINETKNIQTAISRFEVIKINFERLFNYMPSDHKLNLALGEYEFNTINDLYKIDEMKSEFLSDKFKDENKKEEVYSKSLSEWVKLFNKSIEDDVITEDELIALENLQENLGLNEKDTAIYWEKYRGTLPVKSNQELISYDELNSINNDNWKLTLQFGKSQSNIFKMVLSSVEVLPSYRKYSGKNDEEIYEVTFSPNEILEFDTLWSKVKTWKSTIIKINDEIIESKTCCIQ